MIYFITGPLGAGKSTYTRQLAVQTEAVIFSIDDWMVKLYGPETPQPPNFGWVMERVARCEGLIWQTASQIRGNVILDIGFMKIAQRRKYLQLANAAGLLTELHYLQAPLDLPLQRVLQRNQARTGTFSFEVTEAMFHHMDAQFETPARGEQFKLVDFN